MSRHHTRRPGQRSFTPWVIVALVALAIGLPLCACLTVPRLVRETQARNEPVLLELAYSPEKEALLTALLRDFQTKRPRVPGGRPIVIHATPAEPDAMIEDALAGRYQVITPDSSIWLSQLDAERATVSEDVTLGQPTLVGEVTRYAVSPVVIAMWEDVARAIGHPAKALGWTDLLEKARSDPSFKWSHPSTSSASGLLATLAEFYAASGKTRDLTAADATAQATLGYVSTIEKTVRHYGEGEWALIQQMLQSGKSYLDAVVVQEQLVIHFNGQGRGRLVAIYPIEGTLWEDHPLVLLEQESLTSEQRQAYAVLRDYLLSPDAQKRILEAGYRPVDLDVSLTEPGSPFTSDNGVDPLQPKTTLQMPGSAVLQIVRDVWWYTKRHTNVYLVADVSGSMADDNKIEDARQALKIFLEQIRGDEERVGLISFSTAVSEDVPLGLLGQNRHNLDAGIDSLSADGNTALLDAISLAYQRLRALDDRERINAIVVMTDGQENNSSISLGELEDQVRLGNESGPAVVIFCIAYGRDADMATLRRIAEVSGGQARSGDLDTIRQLYKMLSAYF